MNTAATTRFLSDNKTIKSYMEQINYNKRARIDN